MKIPANIMEGGGDLDVGTLLAKLLVIKIFVAAALDTPIARFAFLAIFYAAVEANERSVVASGVHRLLGEEAVAAGVHEDVVVLEVGGRRAGTSSAVELTALDSLVVTLFF